MISFSGAVFYLKREIDMTQSCPHTNEVLVELQGYSLKQKIFETRQRIFEWIQHWGIENVYISFSGGKDSTVLLDIVRHDFPEVEAVFVNTGLEYPEVVKFVRTFDNVVWLKPTMNYKDVLEKYGYPVISKEVAQKIYEIRTTKSDKLRNKRLHGDEKGNGKLPEKWKWVLDAPFEISHKCCDVMKKRPIAKYERKTGKHGFIGTMATDSRFRLQSYLRYGCNAFDVGRPRSTPMSFWLEENIWEYIRSKDLPYSEIYDKGYANTGCSFCAFGAHNDNGIDGKFVCMKRTHPSLYDYCLDDLGMEEVLEFIGVPY